MAKEPSRTLYRSECHIMRWRKEQLHSRVHRLPVVRFEQQQLTSFAGVVLIQVLFLRLNLKDRLRRCFRFLRDRSSYGLHVIFLWLVLHIMLGFRCLRDRDLYSNDPLLRRVLGLRRMPDVATISRHLSKAREECVEDVRGENRAVVLERLKRERLARVTLDFDGSVLDTRRHAEGTAVGFNPKRKGARSYYPLFCTVAQTGQFLDFHHRPGNVHDSQGATKLMQDCFAAVREVLPEAVMEARMDAAFFDEERLMQLHAVGIEFSASVPFERFPALKTIILSKKEADWTRIDATWSACELDWKPNCWKATFRMLLIRRKTLVQRKGPLQLDLFEPRDTQYEYKVIATNKTSGMASVLFFHNGRGSQEGLLGEAKSGAHLDYIPMRRRVGNQLFTAAALMAHNLGREMQMAVKPRDRKTSPTRAALWNFETLDQLRRRLFQRAGRLTRPRGTLTLTMSANPAAQKDIRTYLDVLEEPAPDIPSIAPSPSFFRAA